MKTTKILKIAILLLTFTSIIACNGNKSEKDCPKSDSVKVTKDSSHFVLKHLEVDKKRIMPYVTCSEQVVDSLLAIADTIYSNTDNYKLEDLNMGTENYNDGLKKDYNDTIPTIISLFDSYARITNSGMDEANASFVWHEVAKMQMKHFFETTGNKWQEPNGYEKLFKVADGMMWTYSAGSQSDMNGAAWHSVMPTDYRLIDAYKHLSDLCNDKEIVKLIHDDYMYTLTIYHEHRDGIEEWYSDLSREQGELFNWILKTKLDNINMLIKKYKKGQIGINAVKKNLQVHLCLANKRQVKLTKDFLDRERDDFR